MEISQIKHHAMDHWNGGASMAQSAGIGVGKFDHDLTASGNNWLVVNDG